MSFPAHRWRAPIAGAVTGLVVAAAIVGQSALASGGGAATPGAAATATTGSADQKANGVNGAKGRSEDPGDAPFLAAVTQMVRAGTISDAQARVLDADIRTGGIDPDELVANGTLTSAQAQAVMDRLGAVKRSLAQAAQPG